MYCLDRQPKPSEQFHEVKKCLAPHFEGSLAYRRVDVQDAGDLDSVMDEIAGKHSRMDGLIAAAGVQNVTPALEYPPDKIGEVRGMESDESYLLILLNTYPDDEHQLWRSLLVRSKLRKTDDQTQHARLTAACRIHEWSYCKQRIHSKCLQLL